MKKFLTTLLVINLMMAASILGQQYQSIGTMNTDGSNNQRVYKHSGDIDKAYWSPDMSKVTFHSSTSSTGRNEIFTYDIYFDQLCQLTSYGNNFGQNSPRFLDDTTIWYSYTQQAGFSELAEIIFDGCDVLDSSLLTDYDAIGQQVNEFDLSENYIAYCVQNKSYSPTGEIYKASINDVTNATQLTFNSTRDRFPDINPAESHIVFCRDDGLGTAMNIFTMEIDGSNQKQLTFLSGSSTVNNTGEPQWSEDGTKIYYSFLNDGQWDIYVMNANADDTSQQNITNTPDYNERICEIRYGKLLYITDEVINTGEIIFTSVSARPCDNDTLLQPVMCNLSQPAKGATISIDIPENVEIFGVSYGGLISEDWDFTTEVINEDSNYILVNLLNLFGERLPVDTTTMFYIQFKTKAPCIESDYIYWELALTDDPSRSSRFSDTLDMTFYPPFVYNQDSTEIVGYTPGDANNSEGEPDISDITFIISYLYLGGPEPCIINALDANGGCDGPDISDITRLISYLYLSGPTPECGCIYEGQVAPKATVNNKTVSTVYQNGQTIITLITDEALYGLQLDMTGNGTNEPIQIVSNELEMFYSSDKNMLKIGLFDMEGTRTIKSGTNRIIELEGEYEIVNAVASDMSHQSVYLAINPVALNNNLPESFALHQNFPNPFNPITEISFDLPHAGDVKLEIFNIMGQKVTTLIEQGMGAGHHTVQWDASNNASGVYFYKITAGYIVESKKMLLLK